MNARDYKKLRKQIGTQKEVAVVLGVTRETISNRETGTASISTEAELALRRLAEIQGVGLQPLTERLYEAYSALDRLEEKLGKEISRGT